MPTQLLQLLLIVTAQGEAGMKRSRPHADDEGTATTANRAELRREGVGKFDKRHVVHPYVSMVAGEAEEEMPVVVGGKGARLVLEDGSEVLDGVSSWWSAVHGYARKELDEAVTAQLGKFAHVMFGGLTHAPAAELAALLLDIAPKPLRETDPCLTKVFYADSGSVAVEVAIKMALQFWHGSSSSLPGDDVARDKLLTVRGGYHGDTFGAMAVCDPDGMHGAFNAVLAKHVFVDAPRCEDNGCLAPTATECACPARKQLEDALRTRKDIAAVIMEPLLQGAGGMFVYSPHLLRAVRDACTETGVLLIMDEIATGFGRTGTLFAVERVPGLVPDVMLLGKALTGGYMTMGVALTTDRVAHGVSKNGTPLMHGPTFMANALACSVAKASVELLLASPWRERVSTVERLLREGLAGVSASRAVRRVRVLGAMACIETVRPFDLASKAAVRRYALRTHRVWLRPFGVTLYTMPPFNAPLTEDDVRLLVQALVGVVRDVLETELGWSSSGSSTESSESEPPKPVASALDLMASVPLERAAFV